MSFAETFRRHVIPRLRKVARQQSFFAVLLDEDVDTVCITVEGAAAQLGADRLGARRADLDAWIASHVAAEFAAAKDRVEGHQAAIAAEIIADPVAHYSALAEGCADPEGARWAFAAINPRYRAHLNAERRNHG